MKTLNIEGFTVHTDIDEQNVFQKLLRIYGIDPNSDEIITEIECALLSAGIIDFIEKVGIADMPVTNYFYENCRGYNDRRLEPFNWRASKSKLTMIYTGSQGGDSWKAIVEIN